MDLSLEIENTVKTVMQTWKIPGLALVIVKDDQVLMTKGFGIRKIGESDKVEPHTLFGIGSNTKAFTATAIGLLVQDGKIGWDDPVTKYIPFFRLQDENATRLITIRDLLCHRSGLGTWAGDVLLLSNYSTEEIVRRLGSIPPEFGFRAGYGYSNLMFITAGLVISTVSGLSWDDFIAKRIFEPLGFRDSVTNSRFFREDSNIAIPHEEFYGNLQSLPKREDAHVGAAGSICASVADIALWLRMQLNQGRLDGKQIVDETILAETHKPHTPIQLTALDNRLFPSRHFLAYGLGWSLSDLHGRKVIRHTGGVDGMLSGTVFIPEEQLGIAVFTNKLPNPAHNLIPNLLIDKFMGAPERDWIQLYTQMDKENNAELEKTHKQKLAVRVLNAPARFEIEKFTGDYESSILGGANLKMKDGKLKIQLQVHQTVSGSLEHWHYDTFLCKWDDPVLGESLIPFISDGQGNVVEFKVKIREDWIDPLEHSFIKR
jgi:CubicO group peptidase (beta-lactamase class C family)